MYKFYNEHATATMEPLFLQALQANPVRTVSANRGTMEDAIAQTENAAIGTSFKKKKGKTGGLAYDSTTLKYLSPISGQMLSIMNRWGVKDAKITCLPVFVNSASSPNGPMPFAVFRIDSSKGTMFVDDGTNNNTAENGDYQPRRYSSFNDWKSNNQLFPNSRMTYPVNGELKLGPKGQIALHTDNTPQTPHGLWDTIQNGIFTYGIPVGMALAEVSILAAPEAGALEALGEGLFTRTAEKLAPGIADEAFARGADQEFVTSFAKLGANTVGWRGGAARALMLPGRLAVSKVAQWAGMGLGADITYYSGKQVDDAWKHGTTLNPFKNLGVMTNEVLALSGPIGIGSHACLESCGINDVRGRAEGGNGPTHAHEPRLRPAGL